MRGFLLDTNIPSELTRPQSDPHIEAWLIAAAEEDLYLSVVSLGEIIKGLAVLPEGRRQRQLEAWVDGTLRSWFAGRILPITEAIAVRWGRLTADS